MFQVKEFGQKNVVYLCPLCGQVNVNFMAPEVHYLKRCPEPWKRLVSWGCHPVPLMTWAPFADLFTGPAASLEVRRELGAAGFVFETAEGWATLSSGPFSTLTGMEKVAAAAVFAHYPSRSKYFRCPVCLRVESLSPSAHRCTRGNTQRAAPPHQATPSGRGEPRGFATMCG